MTKDSNSQSAAAHPAAGSKPHSAAPEGAVRSNSSTPGLASLEETAEAAAPAPKRVDEKGPEA